MSVRFCLVFLAGLLFAVSLPGAVYAQVAPFIAVPVDEVKTTDHGVGDYDWEFWPPGADKPLDGGSGRMGEAAKIPIRKEWFELSKQRDGKNHGFVRIKVQALAPNGKGIGSGKWSRDPRSRARGWNNMRFVKDSWQFDVPLENLSYGVANFYTNMTITHGRIKRVKFITWTLDSDKKPAWVPQIIKLYVYDPGAKLGNAGDEGLLHAQRLKGAGGTSFRPPLEVEVDDQGNVVAPNFTEEAVPAPPVEGDRELPAVRLRDEPQSRSQSPTPSDRSATVPPNKRAVVAVDAAVLKAQQQLPFQVVDLVVPQGQPPTTPTPPAQAPQPATPAPLPMAPSVVPPPPAAPPVGQPTSPVDERLRKLTVKCNFTGARLAFVVPGGGTEQVVLNGVSEDTFKVLKEIKEFYVYIYDEPTQTWVLVPNKARPADGKYVFAEDGRPLQIDITRTVNAR